MSVVQMIEKRKLFMEKRKPIFIIASMLVLLAALITLFDIVVGMSLSIEDTPKTGLDYIELFNTNRFLGFYNLDFINFLNTFVIFAYFIVIIIFILKRINGLKAITLLLITSGTVMLVINNGAFEMFRLSRDYFLSNSINDMQLILENADSLLERSSHGSISNFYGYFILSISNIFLAYLLFKEGFIRKTVSILGLVGYIVLSVYVILITFVFELTTPVMGLAAIGGILALFWQFHVVKSLLTISKSKS